MKHLQRWALLSTLVLVLHATAGASAPAAAQTTGSATQLTTEQLKARCRQLIAYFDRWAVGRSNDSDGRRNHTRLGAEIDCQRGDYAEGIAIMERLLRSKKLTSPSLGLPDEPEDYD
jgi:hypothetical protein